MYNTYLRYISKFKVMYVLKFESTKKVCVKFQKKFA